MTLFDKFGLGAFFGKSPQISPPTANQPVSDKVEKSPPRRPATRVDKNDKPSPRVLHRVSLNPRPDLEETDFSDRVPAQNLFPPNNLGEDNVWTGLGELIRAQNARSDSSKYRQKAAPDASMLSLRGMGHRVVEASTGTLQEQISNSSSPEIQAQVSIGRGTESDNKFLALSPYASTISREHLDLSFANNTLYVRDKSKYGTALQDRIGAIPQLLPKDHWQALETGHRLIIGSRGDETILRARGKNEFELLDRDNQLIGRYKIINRNAIWISPHKSRIYAKGNTNSINIGKDLLLASPAVSQEHITFSLSKRNGEPIISVENTSESWVCHGSEELPKGARLEIKIGDKFLLPDDNIIEFKKINEPIINGVAHRLYQSIEDGVLRLRPSSDSFKNWLNEDIENYIIKLAEYYCINTADFNIAENTPKSENALAMSKAHGLVQRFKADLNAMNLNQTEYIGNLFVNKFDDDNFLYHNRKALAPFKEALDQAIASKAK